MRNSFRVIHLEISIFVFLYFFIFVFFCISYKDFFVQIRAYHKLLRSRGFSDDLVKDADAFYKQHCNYTSNRFFFIIFGKNGKTNKI